MMCEEYREQIHLYIDNELNEADKAEFEKHLNACESCRKEYKELTAMIHSVKSEPLLELPDNFHQEVMAKLKRPNQYSYRKYAPVAAGLAIVLLCMTALSTVRSSFFAPETNGTPTLPSGARSFSANTFEGSVDSMIEVHHDPIEFFSEPDNSADLQFAHGDSISFSSNDDLNGEQVETKTYFAIIAVDDLDSAVSFLDAIEGVAVPPNAELFYPEFNFEQVEIGRHVERTLPLESYDFVVEQLQQYGRIQNQEENGTYTDTELKLHIFFMKNTF